MPWLFFPLEKPIVIDDKTQLNELPVTIHNFDPTAAERGKTVLTLMLENRNPEYWMNLCNSCNIHEIHKQLERKCNGMAKSRSFKEKT